MQKWVAKIFTPLRGSTPCLKVDVCVESTYFLPMTVTMMQKIIGAMTSTTIPDIVAINQMSGNGVVRAAKNEFKNIRTRP